jgi:hypothetical protein
MTRKFTLISLDSAIEKLEPFIPASQSATLMHYSSVLRRLVNSYGYSESIALHLVLFEYAEGMNSERTKPALKPSVSARMAST